VQTTLWEWVNTEADELFKSSGREGGSEENQGVGSAKAVEGVAKEERA